MSLFRKKEKTKEKTWHRKNPKVYSGVPKKTNKKRKMGIARIFYGFLFLSFLATAAYIFLFSPFLEIENISVQGNESISSEKIAEKAKEALGGNYKKYFSKRNFFFVQKDEIKSALKGAFRRLGTIETKKEFPKTIVIKVSERNAEMVWCSAGVCYLVDRGGLVYSGASAAEEQLRDENFLTMIDDNAKEVEIEKTYIDKDFIEYLEQMNAILKNDLGFEIDGGYHTPALASYEIIANLKEGWRLKLGSSVSPEESKRIIETLFDKELSGDKRANLDYLDLSIKGKVYYKLKVQN